MNMDILHVKVPPLVWYISAQALHISEAIAVKNKICNKYDKIPGLEKYTIVPCPGSFIISV